MSSKHDITRIKKESKFPRHYLPDTAQAESETRRKNAKQPFKNVSESALELVKKGLKDYHSPEQIAGRLKKAGQESLSHETIYQMIYQNYP